jgi:hypothetical protein
MTVKGGLVLVPRRMEGGALFHDIMRVRLAKRSPILDQALPRLRKTCPGKSIRQPSRMTGDVPNSVLGQNMYSVDTVLRVRECNHNCLSEMHNKCIYARYIGRRCTSQVRCSDLIVTLDISLDMVARSFSRNSQVPFRGTAPSVPELVSSQDARCRNKRGRERCNQAGRSV